MDESDVKRVKDYAEEYVKETEEYIKRTEEYVKRSEELMGEIQRRLKILDSVAVILENYPDSVDDKRALDEIRSNMKRYLEARAYGRSLSSKEDEERRS